MRSVPPDGGETQPIIRIVDVLPAPFGPRKPNASPRSTSKSTPSTATSSPNRARQSGVAFAKARSMKSSSLLCRVIGPMRPAGLRHVVDGIEQQQFLQVVEAFTGFGPVNLP